jgi:3-phenylpropionate/trans-cinnamate dioxygenase ferredoxin reductase component
MTNSAGHVIVGASAAGISAALAMRRAGFDAPLTIIDQDPNLPYERPPLSKSLLGEGVGALKPILAREAYAEAGIDLMLGETVEALNPATHRLRLSRGQTSSADKVLLALGVRARRLEVPGSGLENVLTLRDATDAARLTGRLQAGGPLVVVGAGFIGLELAALARTHGIAVTAIEVAPLPLAALFGPEIGHLVRQLHLDHGVRLRLGATVRQFLGHGSVEALELGDGERIEAATVVIGVGVLPRTSLASAAGAATDRAGIVVDQYGRTSEPWLFAAGDVASQPHPHLAARGRIEHWDAAMRHGAAAGKSMVGDLSAFTDAPYAWSDQYGLTYQAFGRPQPGDRLVLRDGYAPRRFLAFWLRGGRLVAVLGLDAGRDISAAKRMIEAGAVVSEDALRASHFGPRRQARTGRQSVSSQT